jgi:hypothetical protein
VALFLFPWLKSHEGLFSSKTIIPDLRVGNYEVKEKGIRKRRGGRKGDEKEGICS